jgi:hypothetical protein
MINLIHTSITNVTANFWTAFMLYWLPLILCAVGYLIRTWQNYQKDIKARAKCDTDGKGYYSPTDTLGSLIARAIVTILPIGNMLAAIFDVAPDLFGSFFKWMGKIFNQPLVPERKRDEK